MGRRRKKKKEEEEQDACTNEKTNRQRHTWRRRDKYVCRGNTWTGANGNQVENWVNWTIDLMNGETANKMERRERCIMVCYKRRAERKRERERSKKSISSLQCMNRYKWGGVILLFLFFLLLFLSSYFMWMLFYFVFSLPPPLFSVYGEQDKCCLDNRNNSCSRSLCSQLLSTLVPGRLFYFSCGHLSFICVSP